MNPLYQMLSQRNIFGNLDHDTKETIVESSIKKTYLAGEIMVHQEDIWPYFFLVETGVIHAMKESSGGRSFVATALTQGEVFWGLAFFIENAKMPVLFRAQTDATIHLWSREVLVPIIEKNGAMAFNLCQIMISRMQLASEIVDELAFQPVMGRLAGLLLDVYGDAGNEFRARELTLDDMAARIGTTREMVCRHLYRFAEKGVIDIRRTELKINNKNYLEIQSGKEKSTINE